MGNAITRALARVGLWTNESPDLAPDPWDSRAWNGWGGYGHNHSGQHVSAESALQIDVVAAVMERLGGTISALPMMVFERTGEGDDGQGRAVARDHPLYTLLHNRPSERVTAQLFRDEQTRHLALWRNCYSRILPDPDTGHPIGSLEIIHPRRIQRIAMGEDGHAYYTVRKLDGTGQADTFRDDDIWHIKRAPLTDDGLMGKPVWETSRETLGYAQAVQQYGALYFKNGGSGGGFYKHPGNFASIKDRDAFLEAAREGGIGLNRHKDRLLLFGMEYVANQVKNDEAQFIESKKQAGQAVCRIFNMPPHMAGILDNATFSNIEQQSIEFVVYTLGPIVAAIEQAASADLLIGPDRDRYFVEINVAGLLRGDIKTRWTAFAQGRQWGWLSVNDIRRFENMDPIGPGGDQYVVPLNMSPTGQPTNDGTATDPNKPADGNDPADNPDDPDAG